MPIPITAPQITSVIKWFPEAKRKPAVKEAKAKLETTTGIFHGEFEKYLQNKNEVKPAAAKLNVVWPEKMIYSSLLPESYFPEHRKNTCKDVPG